MSQIAKISISGSMVAAAFIAALSLDADRAEATTLIFNESAPGLPASDHGTAHQDYGDRVTATAQGGFTYEVGAEGFTPNVTVTYGPAAADPALWRTGYGDLTNVLIKDGDAFPTLEVTFTADPGFLVELYSFDVAAYTPHFSSDPTINQLGVFDETGTYLFNLTDVVIEMTGHSNANFESPLVGRSLTIIFDAINLGDLSDDIALDNIRFGQRVEVITPPVTQVPEPAMLALFGVGLGGLALLRRRDWRTAAAA